MHNDNDNALGGLFALLISLVGFHLLANHTPNLRTIVSVHPRHWDGIIGIFTHSLFHLNNQHLYNSLIGLFTLGTLVILVSPRQWWQITCWCSIMGGTLLFLFGDADTRTIGTSGVIFGYLGYLMTVGIIHNRFVILLLSVAVVVIYGDYLQGMNPLAVAQHIS
jgi:membrane associated rhomboid family serine protease